MYRRPANPVAQHKTCAAGPFINPNSKETTMADKSGVPGLNDGKDADAYEVPAQNSNDTSFVEGFGEGVGPRFPKGIEKSIIDPNLGQSKKSGC
jgi:hypothetical protein